MTEAVTAPADLAAFKTTTAACGQTNVLAGSELDTNLIGVDRIEVGANSNTLAGIAVTQSGLADLVRLYDSSTQVVTVTDTGDVGIGDDAPNSSYGTNLSIHSTGNNTGAGRPCMHRHQNTHGNRRHAAIS